MLRSALRARLEARLRPSSGGTMPGRRPGSQPAGPRGKGAAATATMNSETAQLRHGVIAAVAAYLLAYLVYAIVEQQALFADGAAVLLRAVGAQGVSSLDANRIVADALFQWPVLAASRLGVTDLETLSYLLGVGYHYLVVVSL